MKLEVCLRIWSLDIDDVLGHANLLRGDAPGYELVLAVDSFLFESLHSFKHRLLLVLPRLLRVAFHGVDAHDLVDEKIVLSLDLEL